MTVFAVQAFPSTSAVVGSQAARQPFPVGLAGAQPRRDVSREESEAAVDRDEKGRERTYLERLGSFSIETGADG